MSATSIATDDNQQPTASTISGFLMTGNRRIKKNRQQFDKNFSRKYYFSIDGVARKVCKVMFQKTLSVSSGRIMRALKSGSSTSVPRCDMRGKQESANKLPQSKWQGVVDQIGSFPTNVSHYTRTHSDVRRYLAADLSVAKMYRLYVDKCRADGNVPVKRWAYRFVFNTKFNLSFHPRYMNTCKKCDVFKVTFAAENSEVEKNRLKAEHDLHLRKAELARSAMASDRKRQSDPKYDAFTFDLQKVFSVPSLTTNEAYYCRQLSVYNLGIHSLSTNEAVMNVWHEGIASRGANEIGSCVQGYCLEKAAQGITRMIVYSDSCGSQTRNLKIALMWTHIVQTTGIEEINHKFLVSGHSYLPNDTDFGIIEKAKPKSSQVFIPEQWYKIIEESQQKNPFRVREMCAHMFKSVDPLMAITTNRKKVKMELQLNG